MKTTGLLAFLIILASSLFAQETQTYQTFKNHKQTIEIKGMGAPMIDFSGTVDAFTFLWGGGAAAIINKNLYIGGFGYSAYNGLNPDGLTAEEDYENYFDYGGIWAGYIFKPNELIHPIFDIKAGWGNLAIDNLETGILVNFSTYVIKPSFELEMNINRYLKIGLDVHYRHVGKVEILTSTYDLSGTGVGLSFKFGWFE
ncbi:MAG: hypothetical protein K9H64_05570 [Bacteroidales bacterium]|nr:hypothetical protein [Bacteroidales bacterium]MCF8455769.1 hypothetical protein [Bacteroidales bacterium]